MQTSSTSQSNKKLPLRAGAVLLWLILWQIAFWAVDESLLLPSPAETFCRLGELLFTADFWLSIANSCRRIMTGYLAALAAGSLLGGLTAFSDPLYEFVKLPMGIIKATPVASFIILALVWIQSARLSAFVAFLMVLPIVWTNVHQGFRQADPQLLEMAKVFRLPKPTVLRTIYLPQVLPYLLSAAQVSIGLAWKSGIAGEVLGTPRNFIGTQLYNAKVYLLTADLFAWTAVVILLSMLFSRLFVILLARLAAAVSGKAGAVHE